MSLNTVNKVVISQILSSIYFCLEVTEDDIRSGEREANNIMDARKIFVALVYDKDSQISPTDLGKFLRVSHSPHSRVNYYKRKHNDHYDTDSAYKQKYDEVVQLMENEVEFAVNKEWKNYLQFLENKRDDMKRKALEYEIEYNKVVKQIEQHNEQRDTKAGA